MVAAVERPRDVHGFAVKELLKLLLFCHRLLAEVWKHEAFDLGLGADAIVFLWID